MSATPNDGGPAFPRGHDTGSDGMTLRDFFAAAALAGSAGYFLEQGSTDRDCAFWAYSCADEMLFVRNLNRNLNRKANE